jgi:uncharacterized membrane protein YfcA
MLLMMIALLVIGAFTGFMAGLLGVGGGMMLTPFMTFLFITAGFPDELVIKMALATSLTTILFTSVTSVRAHHQTGKVRCQADGAGCVLGNISWRSLCQRIEKRMAGNFLRRIRGLLRHQDVSHVKTQALS